MRDFNNITALAESFEKLAQENWWVPLKNAEFIKRIKPLDLEKLTALSKEISTYISTMTKAMGIRASMDPRWLAANEKLKAVAREINSRESGEAASAQKSSALNAVIDNVMKSPMYSDVLNKANAAAGNAPKESVVVNLVIDPNGAVGISSNNPKVQKTFAPVKVALETLIKKNKVKIASRFQINSWVKLPV
jgi:hypothetical protein